MPVLRISSCSRLAVYSHWYGHARLGSMRADAPCVRLPSVEPTSVSCGTPSALASLQVRTSLRSRIGLKLLRRPAPCCCMYLLTDAFSAVLPVPNTSHTAASRGTALFQLGPGIFGKLRSPIQVPAGAF